MERRRDDILLIEHSTIGPVAIPGTLYAYKDIAVRAVSPSPPLPPPLYSGWIVTNETPRPGTRNGTSLARGAAEEA